MTPLGLTLCFGALHALPVCWPFSLSLVFLKQWIRGGGVGVGVGSNYPYAQFLSSGLCGSYVYEIPVLSTGMFVDSFVSAY